MKKWLNFSFFTSFFIILILLAIFIRLYFFILTLNQPLWWDEAEYLNIARTFATGIELPNLGIVRPILLSLLISPFYYFMTDFLLIENILRGIMVVFSLFAILGTFLCGKELYGKWVGLFSAFFLTVFSLMLYLETKIMTDIPSFTFFIFGIYFFYKYLVYKSYYNVSALGFKSKYLYLSSISFAVGTLFKINMLIFFFILLLFYIIKKDIKIKPAFIASIIFAIIMIPYIIYGYMKYNLFVFTGAVQYVSPTLNSYLSSFIINMISYAALIFKYIFIFTINYQISILILFVSFFLIIFTVREKRKVFLCLIILTSLITSSFFIAHLEDRYIINCFFGIFILLSALIIYLYKIIKNKNRTVASIFIIILILLIASTQIWTAQMRIDNSIKENFDIKEVGLWLRNNLTSDEVTISTNPMQIGYYSNHNSFLFPNNKTELDVLLKEKNVKYFVIFEAEKSLAFVNADYDYKDLSNFTVVNQTSELPTNKLVGF